MPQDSARTVTLHIGRHKTGTSSIQSTLAANYDLLRSRGVLYPASLPENNSSFFARAFFPKPEQHPSNKRYGHKRGKLKRLAQQRLDALAQELAAFDGHQIIFSAESACFLPPRGIRRIKTTFDELIAPERYQVILYTRDPVSRALSGIQQNVKGNGLTLEDAKQRHLEGGGKTYRDIATDYAEVFGPEALVLRSFEAAVRSEAGLFHDFAATAGFDPAGLQTAFANDSIAAEIVHFLSWLYEGPRLSEAGELRTNRKTRVPLPEADRARLYAVKGAKADFLTRTEIDTLWDTVADDMAFLSDSFGIRYSKPDPDAATADALFGPAFMEQIAAVLPTLSAPLQTEMERFLHTRGP